MAKKWIVGLGLIVLVTSGCSHSETAPSVSVSVAAPSAAATIPAFPGPSNSSGVAEPSRSPSPLDNVTASVPPPAAPPVPQFSDMGDLFAPPKVVAPVVTAEPTEREPEAVIETQPDKPQRPQLRLVGFVEVDGLKALLAIEGKLNVVSVGESADGLQILAIEPPAVTLKQGEDGEEFELNLFEQAWSHKPNASSANPGAVGGRPVIPTNSAARFVPQGFGNTSAYSPAPAPSFEAIGAASSLNLPGIPMTETGPADANKRGEEPTSPRMPSAPGGLPGVSLPSRSNP